MLTTNSKRILCYLCGMPRSPWATLREFSEPVCRSCVNYEGAECAERSLVTARRMKTDNSDTGQGSSRLHTREGLDRYSRGNSSICGQSKEFKRQAEQELPWAQQKKMAVMVMDILGSRSHGLTTSIPSTLHPEGNKFSPWATNFDNSIPELEQTKGKVTSASEISLASSGRPDQAQSFNVDLLKDVSDVSPNNPLLICNLCAVRLEDKHFVQCPSVGQHKFCFPCSAYSIKKQGTNNKFCPSGERCTVAGTNQIIPWTFIAEEITQILQRGLYCVIRREESRGDFSKQI